MNLKDIAILFNDLKRTTSLIAKQELLRMNHKDEDLKTILQMAYNPYIKFYVTQVKPELCLRNSIPADSVDWLIEVLDPLSEREITGNAALAHVAKIYKDLPEEFKPYLEKILSKDLKIGVAEGIINKVWPDLIPEYHLPLCKRFKQMKRFKPPYLIEPKKDGERCNAFILEDGSVELVARSGFLMTERFPHIIKQLQQWTEARGYMLDGEIKAQTFNETSKTRSLAGDTNETCYLTVWDIIPIIHFENEEEWISLIDRKEVLKNMFHEYGSISSHIVENHYDEVETLDEIDCKKWFEYWSSRGEEGFVAKEKYSPFFYKRDTYWFKYKRQDFCADDMKEASLEIVDFYNGDKGGQFEHVLGGFVCQGVVDGITVTVNVGGGYKKPQRYEFWEKRFEMIGKIIDVDYQETTINKAGQPSLRFPIFKRPRPDLTSKDLCK
jgi:ATP-dependent DNA ligase